MNINYTTLNKLLNFCLIIAFSYFLYAQVAISSNLFYYYTPDTWYYILLGGENIVDFTNQTNLIRQYQIQTNFNISFPLGWPILIALINTLFSFGWRAPLVLVLIFLALLNIYVYVKYKEYKSRLFLLAFTIASLYAFTPFVLDAKAGHTTIAFSLFLLISISYLIEILTEKKQKNKNLEAIISGIFFGLAILVRNEAKLYVPLFIIIILYYKSYKVLISLLIAYSLTVPSMIFNKINIGYFSYADITRQFFNAYNTFNTDYVYGHEVTLIEKPLIWLSKIKVNFYSMIDMGLSCGLQYYLIIFIVICVINKKTIENYPLLRKKLFVILYSILVTALFMIASGGIADRYFIFPLILMMVFLCILYGYNNDRTTLIFMCIAFFCFSIKIYSKYEPRPDFFSKVSHPSYLDAVKTRECLNNHSLKNTLFLFSRPWDGTELSYYATILNGNVFFMPNNIGGMKGDVMNGFIKKYSIDSYYLMYGVQPKDLFESSSLGLIKLNCGSNLYKVDD